MSDISTHQEISPLRTLQQRISIVVWIAVLLLSTRGLYAFYGMKDKDAFEQFLTYVTEPIVQLFSFDRIESLNIPGISVLFAIVSILLLSYVAQLCIRLTDLRYSRMRTTLLHQAIQSK